MPQARNHRFKAFLSAGIVFPGGAGRSFSFEGVGVKELARTRHKAPASIRVALASDRECRLDPGQLNGNLHTKRRVQGGAGRVLERNKPLIPKP